MKTTTKSDVSKKKITTTKFKIPNLLTSVKMLDQIRPQSSNPDYSFNDRNKNISTTGNRLQSNSGLDFKVSRCSEKEKDFQSAI